jgi:hypothetical protein
MTQNTPNLTEMGVRNPQEIIDYTLMQPTDDKDVLKIFYRRPKGSFLPKRRSYEFRRLEKPNATSPHSGESRTRHEISPLLREAIEELDTLLSERKTVVRTKKELQEEIHSLTVDFTSRMGMLSKAIEALD